MRRCLLLLAAAISSGCYTTAAVIDLATLHPPSLVAVARPAGGATLTTRTTHGSPPSDVSMSTWMPDLRIRTERVTTTPLTSAAGACAPIVATLVNGWSDEPIEHETVDQAPLLIYSGGLFPLRVSAVPYRLALQSSTCWLIGEYGASSCSSPPLESLVILGDSAALQSIELPVEWGVLSWQRWLWLPTAPVIDAAGLVIVPIEWVVKGFSRWSRSADQKP